VTHRRLLRLTQAHRRQLRLRRASGCLNTSRGSAHILVVDYFTYVACPVASARRTTCRMTHRRLLRIAQAVRRLLRLSRTSGCLGSSRGLLRDSSSTTLPHAGSSSTTSPTPRVRVPRHVARLVAWLVTPLVVYYFASAARTGASTHRAARRAGSSSTTSPTPHVRVPRHVVRLVAWLVTPLIVDYFASAARPGASARRAGSSSTSSPTTRVRLLWHVARLVVWLVTPLVVDYFASGACPGASTHRAARHAAPSRLLRLAQARRRLLHLRRTSGCLGTSRGSSRRSPSTASPMSRVWVPLHVARLVSLLAVDYFASVARPCALARRAARHADLSSTTSPTPRVLLLRHVAQLVA
jgi:hypothetical protein